MGRSQHEVKGQHVYILETNPRHIEDSIIPFSSLASLQEHVNSIIKKNILEIALHERTEILRAIVMGDTNRAAQLFNDATPIAEPINLNLRWNDQPLVIL